MLNHFYARSPSPPARIVILAAVIGPLISSAVILLATVVVYEVWRFVSPALDIDLPAARRSPTGERFAGLLLLLQLALIYFANALSWAGRPMTRAYLGSIVRLQVRTSPRQVKECLDRWCSMLSGRRPHKSAGCRMRAIVRETLYRDIIGFIPVYYARLHVRTVVRRMAARMDVVARPLAARAVDGGHRRLHRGHVSSAVLKLHERDQPPSLFLTWLGAAMTWIKLVAFGAEAVLTVVIVIAATLRVHDAPALYGWRGFIALAVSTTAVTLVLGLGVWSILYRLSTKASRDQDATAPLESGTLSLQRKTGNADRGGSSGPPRS